MTLEKTQRKNIIFLSSSYVNLARLFALNNRDFDVFLILDRKLPFDYEDIENFYTFNFCNDKLYFKNEEKYFDNLGVMIDDYNPDYIVLDNFSKEVTNSFIEFMTFRNSNIRIIGIHHGDLRVEENGKLKYKIENPEVRQFIDEELLISTIFFVEKDNYFGGDKVYSHATTLKELKIKSFAKSKEDIFNMRLRNVILTYHERTKVLGPLNKVIKTLIEK